jgi:hypothetical protein
LRSIGVKNGAWQEKSLIGEQKSNSSSRRLRAEEIVQAGEASWLTTLGLEPSVRTWSSYADD